MNFNFRQKIFLSYVFVFLIFLIMMSPFSSVIVRRVAENAMENRAHELIEIIKSSPNDEALVKRLKELKPLTFFRISVITNERKVLYDSHVKRILGPNFSQDHVVDHPEVLEALLSGKGYAEDYSKILKQKFAYTAVTFNFHGKSYVMRTAFPYRYVKELIDDFEVGFLLLASAVLILFSLMTWFIINHLTKPLQEIISIVALYKEGEHNPVNELRELSARIGGGEDVGKLASTLVSLSERVEKQIKTLREERNEKDVLLESLVEGVIATDSELNIHYANVSAMKFLGLEKQSLIGSSLKNIGHEKALEVLIACQRESQPIVDTLRSQNYFLDIVAVPKRDNNGAILVMLDRSDHYKILEMRKDFIANASHELKTPITIIQGFAETLYHNPTLPEETTKEVTGKIVRNCERMATLIRDLLALADIENISATRIQTFDLIALLEKVKQTILEVFTTAQITLNTPPELDLEADYDLMEMALMNLIQNAVKYSTAPAQVTVNVHIQNNQVTLSISDKGIGIPKADIPKIFDRFYRVNKSHSIKVGGSGLGLSIVDTVIRKHFGKITVDSEVGQGTTFTLVLPLYHDLQLKNG